MQGKIRKLFCRFTFNGDGSGDGSGGVGAGWSCGQLWYIIMVVSDVSDLVVILIYFK